MEDSEEIGASLARGFREHGFSVEWVTGVEAAAEACRGRPPDLVVLDRMLPDGDGLQLLGRLRAIAIPAPVIALSAMATVEDRVAGLEQGADDYLVKPFSFAELLARVRALLRRGAEAPTVLQVADLKLDLRTRQVERAGARVELTSSLFALLECLMRHAGQVVTRKMILEHVWDQGVETATNVVDVYINRLRNKVDKGAARPLIHTVRGLGYVLKDG